MSLRLVFAPFPGFAFFIAGVFAPAPGFRIALFGAAAIEAAAFPRLSAGWFVGR